MDQTATTEVTKSMTTQDGEVTCLRCGEKGVRRTRDRHRKGINRPYMVVLHQQIKYTSKNGKVRSKECYVGELESIDTVMEKIDQRNKPRTLRDYQDVIEELVQYTATMNKEIRGGTCKRDLIRLLRKYRLWDDDAVAALVSKEPMIELEGGKMIPTGENENDQH